MMIFWSLGVMLRGMDVCLLEQGLRRFYVILIESYKDSNSFLLIVGYICFVFALVNSLLHIGNEDNPHLSELTFISF